MQVNVVGMSPVEGESVVERVASKWLADFAEKLAHDGTTVERWCVVDERLPMTHPAPGPAGDADDGVRRVHSVQQLVTTMMQEQLLPQLIEHTRVAVVAAGYTGALALMNLDQMLRAASARARVQLIWLAPEVDAAATRVLERIDFERLKRACSIVASTGASRQWLATHRVDSLLMERGEDGARRITSGRSRPAAARSSEPKSSPGSASLAG